MAESWEEVLPKRLEDVRSQFSDAHWSWDRRHRTALYITRLDGIDAKWEWLQGQLPEKWTSETLKTAPHLRFLVERLKGLEPAQELISHTIDEEWVLFAAFWPWKDEDTVSIRVGAAALAEGWVETSDLEKALREAMTSR